MTNEEAIKRLEYFKKQDGITNLFNKEVVSSTQELLDICIEALKKQIPKKPCECYDGYAGGNPVWEYECPECDRELDEDDHHCVCGQAILWEETK